MKKFVSILLAVAMIMALATTAFAADEENTVILTISGAANHSYKVYQIFVGDVATNEDGKNVLSNVKFGEHYGNTGTDVPADILAALTTPQTAIDFIELSLKENNNILTPVEGQNTIIIEGLAPGYYLVEDVTDSKVLPDGETRSPIMLQVLETTTIASKHASITSKKKVDDKNDSNNEEVDVYWQDSADYDVGDNVPFQLSVTVPSTFKTYDDYHLTFHDSQAPGFDTPQIKSVYVLRGDGSASIAINPVTAENLHGYTLTVGNCTNPDCEFKTACSFTIEIGDLLDIYGDKDFADGDQIIVEYESQLNGENVHIGNIGNENGMFVCHPDGHTPVDYVAVFTYELTAHKIDGTTDAALAGAGFTLYKWTYDEAKEEKGSWVPVGTMQGGKDNPISDFTWTGLDGGRYKLEETSTPAGYNTMIPMEFTINANHQETWTKGGNSALLNVIAKDDNGNIVFNDAITGENGALVEDGKLEGEIENFKGAVLPETGAKGTVMIIGTSALVVMMSAVFMVTRKKMSIYED